MAINPNEDTEFNEALRKHGILPPREPTPPTPSPPASPTLEERLENFSIKELQEIGEDANDDEVERYVQEMRAKRIAEMKHEARLGKFGEVIPISREDYTREVTEASEVDEVGDEKKSGTAVVLFLYKDGIPRSDLTFKHVRTLAARYKRTKFVSIVGDKCIENLPDTRVPMFICYKKGKIICQITSWGADKEPQIEGLEALLILHGVLEPPERFPTRRSNDDEDEDDLDSEDESSRIRSGSAKTNVSQKNVRNAAKTNDDDDSDFDI
ncbi:hypothetical protein EVG20_g2325 [Dentipellis fragilis]|uniref:Phosducin domain-containing protein n=1 Tax=Dentipellis fragilis TaxID=205917 RepID=A0A4Y9ZA17_9AGAM|nr:hypothetical protein EVG20_g2325 [Dentipellis fragilis]